MTFQEVLNAIDTFDQKYVKIKLENEIIFGVLLNAYRVHANDPRGYTDDYFYVLRIDKDNNPQEKLYCKDVISIEEK